jgi:FkbM family methyltransferase
VWRDLEALHEPDQYFAAGIPSPASIRMLDGGACEGDAVRNALTSGGKVERVWCFEPDARNFIALSEWLKAQDGIGEAEVWPCGLWNRSGVLRFSGGTGASSHLDPAGEERVSVVALDETFPVPPPINLVKLDIEGAEAKALNGMKNLLAERRPHLAVCVYHKPEDLWAILLQIEAMVPNYRFYLRSHAYNGFDLVLYGVPS